MCSNSDEKPVWAKDEKGLPYVYLNGVKWYPYFPGKKDTGLYSFFDNKKPEEILAANADIAKVKAFVMAHPNPEADIPAAA